MLNINNTHDINLHSWVTSANNPASDFPIQNLPFASFRPIESGEDLRIGVGIGDEILDLTKALGTGFFSGKARQGIEACARDGLNGLMAQDQSVWSAVRAKLSELLSANASKEAVTALSHCLYAQNQVQFGLPCRIGDYTDFYTSIHHATAVGALYRPDNPLLPNYKWVPIGYHGRASSIAVSGTNFNRPAGQLKDADQPEPIFSASRKLDYELELGIFIGTGNQPGNPIDIDNAEQHVFGVCLLNDWSARDIQAWEYQPLGPFLSKSFMTSISPWIVTWEALAPFRCSWQRDDKDPQPLAYLDSKRLREGGAVNIQLEAYLESALARDKILPPTKLSSSNFVDSYWCIGQMVTHHTVNGCNLRPGDLLGSGTQSGPSKNEAGSLLELSMGGKEAINLNTGESRSFLEDGDKVIFKGKCQTKGFQPIGFGEVSGTVLPCKVMAKN